MSRVRARAHTLLREVSCGLSHLYILFTWTSGWINYALLLLLLYSGFFKRIYNKRVLVSCVWCIAHVSLLPEIVALNIVVASLLFVRHQYKCLWKGTFGWIIAILDCAGGIDENATSTLGIDSCWKGVAIIYVYIMIRHGQSSQELWILLCSGKCVT